MRVVRGAERATIFGARFMYVKTSTSISGCSMFYWVGGRLPLRTFLCSARDIILNLVLFLQIAGNNKNMSKRKQVEKDLNRFKEVLL